MENGFIDLYALQSRMRTGVEELFPESLWVRAEISSVSARNNGHCYMELVQNRNGVTIAKARAVIWQSRYLLLSRAFRAATGGDLSAGMTILVRVQVTYSELYGFTLSIDDLDADVTLGEMERQRQETIARLSADGMMDLQASLSLPVLPYRLAVISAVDAAGYGDFCRHLLDNPYGFRFEVTLFEAAMQGASAPQSISAAIAEVSESETAFDAVLIMRGGGSSLDLACFDNYDLCSTVARCSAPVLTAIGHERDFHVIDMVAFDHAKTPTALADVFLDCYLSEDERIVTYGTRLRMAFRNRISMMESRIELLRSRIHSADPRQLLQRGYTLVSDASGVLLKSTAQVQPGDDLRVMFADGTLECKVLNKK